MSHPLAHLPLQDRNTLLRTIGLRHHWIRNLAASTAIVAAGSWVATGAILFGDFSDYGAPQSLLLYLLFGGGAACLGWSCFVTLERHWRQRTLLRHIQTPSCVWCGHNITGVPINPATHGVICPECGKTSPVAPFAAR